MTYLNDLKMKGYAVIPNILNDEEIEHAKSLFYNWKNTISSSTYMPHGIYKFHEVGQQEHAWFIRTRPKVIQIFQNIWKTEELIVSFDGSCFIEKECNKKNNCWTHTDQSPNKNSLECYQGFVSLTENKERTFIVYEESHTIHNHYFNYINNTNDSKNFHLIEEDFLEEIKDYKKILHVPAGSLVLWDSRTFHQNQYGKPNSEERIVQYVCYLPKNIKSNNKKMQEKRLKYFKEKRTTSHWPSPINVNGLQPQVYGNKNNLIDYSKLKIPELEKYKNEIEKLL